MIILTALYPYILETVLCVLHAGGKFGGDESGYKVSGGLHGVGISVVNALSKHMTVEVARDGNLHRMELARGIPLAPLAIKPLSSSATDMIRGTKVTFQPDPDIFKSTLDFEHDKLAGRFDELAYLNPGLTLTFIDERIRAESDSQDADANRVKVYCHNGGISELVKCLCEDKVQLHPEVDVITINEERQNVIVEIAMRWSKDMYTDSIIGQLALQLLFVIQSIHHL
jgi:DNA gyrase subunit B